MQFIVAFANEKIFNVEAKSIVGAKRMANSLRVAIRKDERWPAGDKRAPGLGGRK